MLIVAETARIFPHEVWMLISRYIGSPIDTRAYSIQQWLRGNIRSNIEQGKNQSYLHLFQPNDVWAWVEQDPQQRAEYLASFVTPFPFIDIEKVCPRELLARYGSQENVRNNFTNNFFQEAFEGSLVDHYEKEKNYLLEIKENERKTDNNEHVISWIDDYLTNIEKLLINAKEREIE